MNEQWKTLLAALASREWRPEPWMVSNVVNPKLHNRIDHNDGILTTLSLKDISPIGIAYGCGRIWSQEERLSGGLKPLINDQFHLIKSDFGVSGKKLTLALFLSRCSITEEQYNDIMCIGKSHVLFAKLYQDIFEIIHYNDENFIVEVVNTRGKIIQRRTTATLQKAVDLYKTLSVAHENQGVSIHVMEIGYVVIPLGCYEFPQ